MALDRFVERKQLKMLICLGIFLLWLKELASKSLFQVHVIQNLVKN